MVDKELEALLKTCDYIINSAWFNKREHSHFISQSVWSGFCKQVKLTKKKLEKV